MLKALTLTVSVLLLLFFLTPPPPSTKTSAVTASTEIEERAASPDSTKLQQGSWYNSAIETITKAEYEFKKDTAGNRYCTPNRKNNLRFFYDENGFTTEPRTTKISIQNIDGSSLPDDTKYRQLPGWKVAFNLDKHQIGKGQWSVAANKAEYIADKVTVQYINNEEGMRQNFIVASPLSDDGVLKINFSINTKLKIKLQDNELQFFHKKAGNVLNYSQLKVWDANNQPLEANFEKDGTEYCINVYTKGAAYPITIDPISTTPSGIMESNQASSQMGISVSSAGDVNGDGYSDVIVGAHLYDNGQTDEGRAYIYHGSDTGTSATAATILESNQASAQFGIAVSTAGDVNGDGYSDVLVGANLYDGGQTDEGAVFVYHGSATGVSTTAAIRLESNVANSNFGISVACAGDVNGDGFSDIITGSNLFSFGQANEGVAIVYRGSATGILSSTAAILQMNQAGARMGSSVASAGDINGDGFSDVVIGIPLYNGGLAGEGAAIIYTGSATGINTTVAATLESNQLNANMGQSVSSAGDVNGDGFSDVVIGANLYDKGQTDEGVAFVYLGAVNGISTTGVDTLEVNQASANFGKSVACAGDVNGDGYSDIIVGANLYENGQTDEGAAFIFRGAAIGTVNTAINTLEANQAAANFGSAVTSAGDINGDGYSDVMVGANLYDNGETDEGAAFVYNGSANGIRPLTAPVLVNSPRNNLKTNQAADRFGTSVASAGDINADGYSDIIVGALSFDNGTAEEGAAFIFYGTANGINTIAADTIEGNQFNSFMGTAVATAGDVNGDGFSDIIVGAPNYDKGQVDEGIAVIYYGSATGIDALHGDTLQSNKTGAFFGNAVSTAGDVNGDGFSDVIVGDNLYDNGETDEGIAILYFGSDTGINIQSVDTLQVNQANAQFGFSVSSAGDINADGYGDIIIGARYYDNGQINEGVAFIFYGSANGVANNPDAFLEDNLQSDEFGTSVAAAGDVNGDGFGDLVIGAPGFDNGMTNAGAIYIYHGTANGINTTPVLRMETTNSQFDNANFGVSVSSAGDINGDGYSDIIAGASQFTFGYPYEGRCWVYMGSPAGITTVGGVILISGRDYAYNGFSVACAGDINGDGYSDVISGAWTGSPPYVGSTYVYYGNGGDFGIRNNLRLYNSDQTTPIQQSNNSDQLFAAGIFAKSPLGRQKGKMVLETVRNGVAFPGNPISNSTTATATDASFTNLGLTGVELKRQAIKMIPTKATNIRARVKYDLSTAITGQVYGPWRYSQSYLTGNTNKILSSVTYNWTGNVSIDWENPANWSSNVVPISTSAVIIPAGRPRYPTINTSTTIKSLSLAPGTSTITATGVNLNITGH